MENYFDAERPSDKPGQTVCDGCWKATMDNREWLWMNFKHLTSQWLCPDCQAEYADEFTKLQRSGL